MIYGERVKYAREKLGMTRMQFAVLLDTTQENIRNIENCKDESRKLGWDKMQKLIEVAKLPKGWFFFDTQEIEAVLMTDTEIFIKAQPGKKAEVSDEEAKEVLDIADRFK